MEERALLVVPTKQAQQIMECLKRCKGAYNVTARPLYGYPQEVQIFIKDDLTWVQFQKLQEFAIGVSWGLGAAENPLPESHV